MINKLLFAQASIVLCHPFRMIRAVESTSRSPIFSWFGSSLAGLPSIRAFGRVQSFTEISRRMLDEHLVSFSNYNIVQRWLSLRLDALSASVVLLVGWLAVMLRDNLSLTLSSLSLSYTLQLTGFLQMSVRLASETESNLTAVERLKQYEDTLPLEVSHDFVRRGDLLGLVCCRLFGSRPHPFTCRCPLFPMQRDYVMPDDPAPHEWPSRGDIEFRSQLSPPEFPRLAVAAFIHWHPCMGVSLSLCLNTRACGLGRCLGALPAGPSVCAPGCYL